MRKISLATLGLLVIFAATGCGTHPPSSSALKTQFREHRSDFVALRDMISQDREGRKYFTVGTDLIGEYWRSDSEWAMDGAIHGVRDTSNRSLGEVLKRVGLTSNRYKVYLEHLHDANATRVTAFADQGQPDEVEFLVYASGIAPAGCLTRIYYRVDGAPEAPEWARWSQQTRLGAGWYALSTCN